VYPVIAEPLIFAGGSHDAVAVAFPAVAVTESGTEGAALIAAAGEALEAVEGPIAFVAITLKV
jgi:hypothetical protein